MKYHTIVNSFRDSGIWPPSAKARLKKMRSYQKKKRTIDEVEQDDLELLALPLTRPPEIWNTAATVRALGDRDPTQFSEPSVQVFHITMKSVDIQLQKAHLTTIEHLALQEKVRNEGNERLRQDEVSTKEDHLPQSTSLESRRRLEMRRRLERNYERRRRSYLRQ
jgi:hypothetical protein